MKIIFKFLLLNLFLFNIIGCNTIDPGDGNSNNDTDTTSHNFSWQAWGFGENLLGSVLYDVAIIDENNIWAVGRIFLNDSLGQPDHHPYGLVHWDGFEWKPKRITAQNPSGELSYITPTGIFVINPSEIWLAEGGSYFDEYGGAFLFNGQNITQAFWLINYSEYSDGIFNNGETTQKFWGTSSTDIYVVGNRGALAHYNGSLWKKIETGTELNIYDIWGEKINTGESEILCVASDVYTNQGKKILQIQNNSVKTISEEGLAGSLNTVWFKPGKEYYLGGDGLYTTKGLNTVWQKNTDWQKSIDLTFSNNISSIRGNDINDIFAVGTAGLLLHYNGKSWMNFSGSSHIVFTGVDLKGNIACVVGGVYDAAIIYVGKGID